MWFGLNSRRGFGNEVVMPPDEKGDVLAIGGDIRPSGEDARVDPLSGGYFVGIEIPDQHLCVVTWATAEKDNFICFDCS